MPEVKGAKKFTFKGYYGWFVHSPPMIALIFSLVLLVAGGSAAYYLESSHAPGEPSPLTSKCSMWKRCG